jgi:hypothetical protein
MSREQKRLGWLVLTLAALAMVSVALVEARTGRFSTRGVSSANPGVKSQATASSTQGTQAQVFRTREPSQRNLSLQPEAFNMGRRLGQRFAANKRDQSTLIGTLTIGAERTVVTTVRKQTDDGEEVEVAIAGSPGIFTWDTKQGALSAGARATGTDRDVIERIVLDSPDQFVLGQLRGASYYTIARNVRPEGMTDNYRGPLWNIVRVDDPEKDEMKRPRSPWRLYYVNVATGLIDRIESEVQGQRISAAFTWADVNGEKVPAQITWIHQTQILMHYSLTNFSHAEVK